VASAAEAAVPPAIEDSLVAAGRVADLRADSPQAAPEAAEQPATSINTAIAVSKNRAAPGLAGPFTGTPRAGP